MKKPGPDPESMAGPDSVPSTCPFGGERPTASWHVDSFGAVRQLLGDARLDRPIPAIRAPGGSLTDRVLYRIETDRLSDAASTAAEHTKVKQSMTLVFSSHRIERTRAATSALAAQMADQFVSGGSPADLSDGYSKNLCAKVMSALLDVPDEDALLFRQWTEDQAFASMSDAMRAVREMLAYIDELVARRRQSPGNDVVTDLLMMSTDDSDDHAKHVGNLLVQMLGIGWEQPARAIDWGVLLLASNRDQLENLVADPSLFPSATEEVLRLFSTRMTVDGGAKRRAYADIGFEGATIVEGDSVFLDLFAANRDADVFDKPLQFDITRTPNPHVTFGHGLHRCAYRKIARLEVEIGLRALLQRVPTIELDEPLGDALGRYDGAYQSASLRVRW